MGDLTSDSYIQKHLYIAIMNSDIPIYHGCLFEEDKA